MLTLLADRPSLVTLARLLAGTLGIHLAVIGAFPAVMIALIWAVVLDWWDGQLARRLPRRRAELEAMGGQLDSFADLVSFSVCPAVVLLSYGRFGTWLVPGALLLVAAGALRLSHFNVFGLAAGGERPASHRERRDGRPVQGGTYRGLPLDANAMLTTGLFLVEGRVAGPTSFVLTLYAMLGLLAVVNVLPIRIPKLRGRWFYGLIAYAVVLTVVYARWG